MLSGSVKSNLHFSQVELVKLLPSWIFVVSATANKKHTVYGPHIGPTAKQKHRFVFGSGTAYGPHIG